MAQKLWRGQKQRERFQVLREEIAKRAEMERASRERAKAKQQREEQERASRAVAGVNHLEIPAELAFIYSKLDGGCWSAGFGASDGWTCFLGAKEGRCLSEVLGGKRDESRFDIHPMTGKAII